VPWLLASRLLTADWFFAVSRLFTTGRLVTTGSLFMTDLPLVRWLRGPGFFCPGLLLPLALQLVDAPLLFYDGRGSALRLVLARTAIPITVTSATAAAAAPVLFTFAALGARLMLLRLLV
jgi:hypothetical protein